MIIRICEVIYDSERNDYFYVCALIEYIARETLNHRGDIVKAIGEEGIKKLLHDAEMDHCLSFEQVSDKISEFNTDLYYQNPDYLEWSYRDGKLLD